MTSDRQLKRVFLSFNRRFFDGELPTATAVFWRPLSEDDGMCCPVRYVEGNFEITIDPRWSGSGWAWKLILLHEMAHLHLWNRSPLHQHGKVYQDEMLRLATAGAFRGIW